MVKENIYHLNPLHFCFDSRLVSPGDLFFAIKGQKTDGHLYLNEVYKKGAVGAIVDNNEINHPNLPLIHVADVKQTLQQLAKEKVESLRPFVIGITGSVGKTTTKEFLFALLENALNVVKTHASCNSQLSFPLSILNFPKTASHYVLEMGMSQKKEMDNLVNIAAPDIAIITNISHSHYENFSALSEIAYEKEKIFHKNNAFKLMHSSVSKWIKDQDVKTYGQEPSNCDYIYRVNQDQLQIQSFEESSPWLTINFTYPHYVENLVAAIICARKLNMAWTDIQYALYKIKPYTRRFEKQIVKGITFINDSYNASEISTKASIKAFASLKQSPNKSILVFGNMTELGSYSHTAHLEVAKAAYAVVDEVYCMGEEAKIICEYFQTRGKNAYFFLDHQSIIEKLKKNATENTLVLVKGANSMQMWQVIEQF